MAPRNALPYTWPMVELERNVSWRDTARKHWEVFAAAGILFVVVAVIDVTPIRQPALVLAFGPLASLILGAFVPLTATRLGAWVGAFAILGVASGDWRYGGLAYPAVAFAASIIARRLRGRH